MTMTISVFNPDPDAGKSTVAIGVANALGMRYPGEVILIDPDKQNVQKRSAYYYGLRTALPKPYLCVTAEDWQRMSAEQKASFRYCVIDTEKSPTNGLTKVVSLSSDIILIPVRPNRKSWTEGAARAIHMLVEASVPKFIICNNYAGGEADAIADLAEGAGVEILAEIPKLPIDDCFNAGWLPQYRAPGQHGWRSIEQTFSMLTDEIVNRLPA